MTDYVATVSGIFDKLASHAAELGIFDSVNTHEPKSPIRSGVTAAVWLQSIGPATSASGLANTTCRAEFMFRIFTNMLSEPQDAIDPNMMVSALLLLDSYSGDFDLGGSVKCIDLLGIYGPALSMRAGYVSLGSVHHRVIDVTVPVIINDLFDQVA
jgi:hypothetical protein